LKRRSSILAEYRLILVILVTTVVPGTPSRELWWHVMAHVGKTRSGSDATRRDSRRVKYCHHDDIVSDQRGIIVTAAAGSIERSGRYMATRHSSLSIGWLATVISVLSACAPPTAFRCRGASAWSMLARRIPMGRLISRWQMDLPGPSTFVETRSPAGPQCHASDPKMPRDLCKQSQTRPRQRKLSRSVQVDVCARVSLSSDSRQISKTATVVAGSA
jgi:hypothetical protein